MNNDLCFSFVMGFDDNILELKKKGFNIEKDDEYYLVSFSKNKSNIFEEFVIKNMQLGFWNEYIGEEIVFIFKYKDGKTEKYILDEENHDLILKLCCEFADAKFTSIKDMLLDNDFYKDKLKG